MPGPAFLHGDSLTLRPVETEDHGFVYRHWNRPTIRCGFARHTPRSREQIAAFFEDSDDAVHFLACRDDEPVGFVWLFGIDEVASRVELGYWVVPDEQGNGYATEIARLAVEYAFDQRGLHKVLARVLDWNDASARVLEKLGFRREGRLREHYYVDGERVDADLYALLATER